MYLYSIMAIAIIACALSRKVVDSLSQLNSRGHAIQFSILLKWTASTDFSRNITNFSWHRHILLKTEWAKKWGNEGRRQKTYPNQTNAHPIHVGKYIKVHRWVVGIHESMCTGSLKKRESKNRLSWSWLMVCVRFTELATKSPRIGSRKAERGNLELD